MSKTNAPDPTLTPTERMLLQGIEARDREIVRLYIDPLHRDYREVAGMIEARLGLEAGALGTTHQIQDGAVVEVGPINDQQEDTT